MNYSINDGMSGNGIILIGNRNDSMTVTKGGVVNDTVVLPGCQLTLIGGSANRTSLKNEGRMYVVFGGTADRTDIWNFCSLVVGAGEQGAKALADHTNVYGGGSFQISSGGTGLDTNVFSGGLLTVSEGGIADSATVTSKGSMLVSAGGSANDITVSKGGILTIYDGGRAATIRENGGYVSVADGANVTFAPNVISGMEVLSSCSASLHAGVEAAGVRIDSQGSLHVYSGGIASDTVIADGGTIHVFSGGTLTGRLVFLGDQGNNSVEFDAGANYVFDLTQTLPGAGARINDFSLVSGAPAYTITVDADQVDGVYTLAENVAEFTWSIKVADVAGTELGTLSVGDPASILGTICLLALSDGVLTLTIGEGTAPLPYTSDGHIAVATTVEQGELYHDTIVTGGGNFNISSGGSAVGVTVFDAELNVSSDGSADDVELHGSMLVFAGGSANDMTIHRGGTLYVSAGGAATQIVENGGNVVFEEGANVSFAENTFSEWVTNATATVHSGTTATTTVGKLGQLHILSGGIALDTMVAGGWLYVSSGGRADNTMGGNLVVYDGGIIDNTTVTGTAGELRVSSGGTANYTLNYGKITVFDGGTVNATTVCGLGNESKNKGTLTVSSGGTANDTVVKIYGEFTVSSGGTAVNTTLNGGNMFLYGSANGVELNYHGDVYLDSRGNQSPCISDITVNPGGALVHSRWGRTEGVVENGGFVDGADSFVANTFTGRILYDFSDADVATVHSGTIANNTTIYGNQNIIQYGGNQLRVFSGGIANYTTINNCYGFKLPGGVIYSTMYYNMEGTGLYVFDGTVNFTTVNSGGVLYVLNGSYYDPETRKDIVTGGTANDTIVSSGGTVFLARGGKLTGRLINLGGKIVTGSDAILDFDLTDILPGAAARFNDLSTTSIEGTPAPAYTITVNANQAEGVYTLAEGAAGFAQSISVVNAAGDKLNTISIGETVSVSGTVYTLTLSDGVLSLKIGDKDTVSPYTSDGLFISNRTQKVSSDEIYRNTLILGGGSLNVARNGSADFTVVNGGRMTVSKGGTANNTTLNGALVSTFNSETIPDRYAGYGILDVNGGAVTDTTVNPGGELHVSEDGIADGTTVNDHGTMVVSGLASADHTTVNSGGTMTCFRGSANNTTVYSGGSMIVSSTKYVSSTTINGGTMIVSSMGGAFATTVNSGSMLVLLANRVNNTTVNGGTMVVSGGEVSSTTINDGTMIVSSMGSAFVTTVNSGGSVSILSRGNMDTVTVNHRGIMTISSGGSAYSVTENGGCVILEEKARASFQKNTFTGLVLSDHASATVHKNTTASMTTVESGGDLHIYSGGSARDVTIHENGVFAVESGGRMTGRITMSDCAIVTVDDDAILNFDLSRAEAGTVLVNDLSIIQGTPLYTLTVDEDLTPGSFVYALAGGAAGFTGTISVMNEAGNELGTLSAGETLRIGYDDYTLNLADGTLSVTVESPDLTPQAPVTTQEKVSWETTGAEEYIVEYSTDDFEHVFRIMTTASATEMPGLPAGTYQWRVKSDDNSDWAVGEEIVSEADPDDAPKVVRAVEDGNNDLFFASTSGTWGIFYYARHVGSINDWNGTNELISAKGKGRIQNLFFGSADPNVLCLTDAENGDAIFVDDAYTGLPEEVETNTARLYRIQEIRAGAGDDIVDMTSQQCEYTGDGLTIRGGDGDDVIWANKGDNLLFGDAGNDRIVGASGNDAIAGGIGDDIMHGGGGNDVFTFCDNWGADTVEQLETGTVTLWFASGSSSNWNADTLTYKSGANSVTVSGVTAEQVTLKFGTSSTDDADLFATLSDAGAFDAFTSHRVFEESAQGLLA